MCQMNGRATTNDTAVRCLGDKLRTCPKQSHGVLTQLLQQVSALLDKDGGMAKPSDAPAGLAQALGGHAEPCHWISCHDVKADAHHQVAGCELADGSEGGIQGGIQGGEIGSILRPLRERPVSVQAHARSRTTLAFLTCGRRGSRRRRERAANRTAGRDLLGDKGVAFEEQSLVRSLPLVTVGADNVHAEPCLSVRRALLAVAEPAAAA